MQSPIRNINLSTEFNLKSELPAGLSNGSDRAVRARPLVGPVDDSGSNGTTSATAGVDEICLPVGPTTTCEPIPCPVEGFNEDRGGALHELKIGRWADLDSSEETQSNGSDQVLKHDRVNENA